MDPENSDAHRAGGSAGVQGGGWGASAHDEDTTEHGARAIGPRLRHILVGHDPGDPAEATLVLGAAAALTGVRMDGEPMPDGYGRGLTLRAIAAELGLHAGAVRRGVRHLVAVGAMTQTEAGIAVVPAAMAQRWANERQRLRMQRETRQLGLRARPLLIAALVAGQVDDRGRLCLGREYLAERTGMPLRTLDRAVAAAEHGGAIHRWSVPLADGAWQLFLAPGRRKEAKENGREGAITVAKRRKGIVAKGRSPSRRGERDECADERREEARPASRRGETCVAKRRDLRREEAKDTQTATQMATQMAPQTRACGRARGASASRPAATPIADLTDALLRTRYRAGLGNVIRRRAACHDCASRLVPTGLTPGLLAQLVEISNARSRDDPGALLAHWLDVLSWREVIDEQQQKQREARGGAEARPTPVCELLDQVITTAAAASEVRASAGDSPPGG